MDGPGSEDSFEHFIGHSFDELPDTVAWSSGRPGRHSRVYLIPDEWWDRLSKREDHHLPGRGHFELRGANHYAVMCGQHPNKDGDGQGFYDWLPGKAPWNLRVAAAPDWLLQAWAELSSPAPKAAKANGFQPRRSHEELLFDLKRVDYLQELFQPANEYSDYKTWLDIGMELHSLSCDFGDPEKLYERWVEWCSDMLNFDEPECRLKWDSFSDKAGGRTFASFVQRAKENPKYVAPIRPKPQGFGDESDKAQEIRDLFQDLYDLLKRDDRVYARSFRSGDNCLAAG